MSLKIVMLFSFIQKRASLFKYSTITSLYLYYTRHFAHFASTAMSFTVFLCWWFCFISKLLFRKAIIIGLYSSLKILTLGKTSISKIIWPKSFFGNKKTDGRAENSTRKKGWGTKGGSRGIHYCYTVNSPPSHKDIYYERSCNAFVARYIT